MTAMSESQGWKGSVMQGICHQVASLKDWTKIQIQIQAKKHKDEQKHKLQCKCKYTEKRMDSVIQGIVIRL